MPPHDTVTNSPAAAGRPVARERRRQARAVTRRPYRVPCRVRLVDTATGEVRTVVGETINISRAGVALQLATDVPVGTWVETLLPHPTGNPMFLCGTVVHSRRTLAANYEIGVRMEITPGVS